MLIQSWLNGVLKLSQGSRRRKAPVRHNRRRRNGGHVQVEQLELRSLLTAALGVTDMNELVSFDTDTPNVATGMPITGLTGDEMIVGIDFRPADGQLYGLSSDSRLYTIDPATAVATQVGSDGAFALQGLEFGVDFNPVADRLRVVSDFAENLRLNPVDGTLTATDTDLAYAPGDINAGPEAIVVASAYTNNFVGAASTTLYGMDPSLDILVTQNPPNAGTLNTVGPLGFDVTDAIGFDIHGVSNDAFAVFSTDGAESALYAIDLTSGAATLVGSIGAVPTFMRGLALVPAARLQFSAATYSIGENGPTATITINRVGSSDGIVTVNFATTNGTATAPQDYADSDQVVTFASGQSTRTVTIPIVSDLLDEANETVNLMLSGPVGNAVLGGQSTAVLTITDDDAGPTVTLSTAPATIAEDAGEAIVTATLSAISGQDVIVDLIFTGTATSVSDFTSSATQIVIPAGMTTGTMTLTAVQDTLDEAGETIVVDISGVTNGTESGMQSNTVTIIDDDLAPTLSINDVTVLEGNAGVTDAVFMITLSSASGQPVTVMVATADGTAMSPSDYVAVPAMTVTFAPGETTKTVTVTVNGDALIEPAESYFVNLSSPTNATILDGQGLGTISNDDSTQRTATLIDDPEQPGRKILVVNGTNGDDRIFIQLIDRGRRIRVKLNGDVIGEFNESSVSRIVANGLAGDDLIHLDAALDKPSDLHGDEGNDRLYGGRGDDMLYGGAGNDHLHGRRGNDWLYGESGHDHLFGGSGHDILLGGTGSDRLQGGLDRDILIAGLGTDNLLGRSGDDILIGGTTVHDDNEVALASIQSEWISGHSYVTRVNNIRAGLGQSNGFRLAADMTVIDDGVVDELFGGTGLDWFFNSGVANDEIRNRRSVERVN